MKTTLGWAGFAALMTLAQPATAQKVERHEQLALAQAVDENCGFLPYVENRALVDIAWQSLELSTFYGMSVKMDNRDTLPKFYEQQAAKAAAMPCNAATAQAIIVPIRSDTINELAIAVATVEVRKRLSQQSLTDWDAVTVSAPSESEQRNAQLLAGYVQKQWGANAQSGWQWALQRAESRVKAKPNDSGWSQLLYMVDYQARAERDKLGLVAGPRPWQRLRSADGKLALTQRRATFNALGNGFVYLTVRDGQVLASAHAFDADDLPKQTGMRLYIRKADAPTLKNSLPLTWDGTWRSQANAFDMTASADKLYGGIVYKATPAAIAALKALNEDDEVEVAIVRGTDDQASSGGSSRTTFKIKGLKAVLQP